MSSGVGKPGSGCGSGNEGVRLGGPSLWCRLLRWEGCDGRLRSRRRCRSAGGAFRRRSPVALPSWTDRGHACPCSRCGICRGAAASASSSRSSRRPGRVSPCPTRASSPCLPHRQPGSCRRVTGPDPSSVKKMRASGRSRYGMGALLVSWCRRSLRWASRREALGAELKSEENQDRCRGRGQRVRDRSRGVRPARQQGRRTFSPFAVRRSRSVRRCGGRSGRRPRSGWGRG